MANTSVRSAVWEHFNVNVADSSRATCKHCNVSVARGGKTTTTWTTTTLHNHMKRHHPSIKLENKTAVPADKPTPSSSSLLDCFDRSRKWSTCDPRAVRYNRLIAEMIALDDEPFSVVNNTGFQRVINGFEPRYQLPSDTYMRQTAVPELYESVKEKVSVAVGHAQVVSLTTDTWTTTLSSESLMSLTSHWIDDQWERRSAILQTSHLPGSHTAANICGKLLQMLSEWKLENKVHVVLRDNARNMSKGLDDAGVRSVGCLAHTLQLCVKAGLDSQRAIEDAVSICRKIATHFSHSTLAKERMSAIQSTIPGLHAHAIIQDVQTRWNSTYYMVQRMLEQKKAVVSYASEHDLPATLTKHQWGLLEKMVAILAPFEEITKHISSAESSLADVIPVVTALQVALERNANDSGVQTMKSTIVSDMRTRFSAMYDEPLFVVATTVDPRYRVKLFTSDQQRRAKDLLHEEIQRGRDSAGAVASQSSPPAKRRRCNADGVHDILDELLNSEESTSSAADSNDMEDQVRSYLALPTISRQESPLTWWRENVKRYPDVATVARRFLSAPSTSVPSERLFSSAGLVYTDRRNHLLPERAEMLLFVKHNLNI